MKKRNILPFLLCAAISMAAPYTVMADNLDSGDMIAEREGFSESVGFSEASLGEDTPELPGMEEMQSSLPDMNADLTQENSDQPQEDPAPAQFDSSAIDLESLQNAVPDDSAFDLSTQEGVFESLNMMQQATNAGENVQLSQIVGEMFNKDISQTLQNNLSLNLPDTFDTGLLNLQYDNISKSLSTNFAAGQASSSSIDCMQLFNNTYGDLYNTLNISEPTLPEGWDASTMLASGTNALSSAYANAMASDSFMQMKDAISIGSVFNTAANGVSEYGLKSASELQGMTAGASAANKASTFGQYASTAKTYNNDFSNWQSAQAEQVSKGIIESSKYNKILDGNGRVTQEGLTRAYHFVNQYKDNASAGDDYDKARDLIGKAEEKVNSDQNQDENTSNGPTDIPSPIIESTGDYGADLAATQEALAFAGEYAPCYGQ